jgi:hypothetical protein
VDPFHRVPEVAVRFARRTPELVERFQVLPGRFCRADFLRECAVVAPQDVQVFGETYQQSQPTVCMGDEVRVERSSRCHMPMHVVR